MDNVLYLKTHGPFLYQRFQLILVLQACFGVRESVVVRPSGNSGYLSQGLKLGITFNGYSHPFFLPLAAKHIVRNFVLVAVAHSLRLRAVQRILHYGFRQQCGQYLGHGNLNVLTFSRIGPVVQRFQHRQNAVAPAKGVGE